MSPGVPGYSVLQRSGVCNKSSINTVISQGRGTIRLSKKKELGRLNQPRLEAEAKVKSRDQ